MDEKQTKAFWNKAFMTDERPLTPAERALIAAAVIPGKSRWDGACDIDRMEAVVKHDPSVLQSIGPALVNVTLSTRADPLRATLKMVSAPWRLYRPPTTRCSSWRAATSI
jgi:hypothetical protein